MSLNALTQGLRASARIAHDRASRATLEHIRKEAPKDSGNLRQGIILRNRSVTSPVMRVEIASTAQAQGFDYPAFINKVPRIKPTKKKFLKFTLGNGTTVFSKGFENPNQAWWAQAFGLALPPSTWDREVAKAFDR